MYPPFPLDSHPYATTTDPTTECTPYTHAPIAQFIPNFPPIWQPAKLLGNDTAGQALWAKIADSIPDTPPKGELTGSTIGVDYDSGTDPDCCEWYFFLRLAVGWRRSRIARRDWRGVFYKSQGTWHQREGPSHGLEYHCMDLPWTTSSRTISPSWKVALATYHFLLLVQGGQSRNVRLRSSQDYHRT